MTKALNNKTLAGAALDVLEGATQMKERFNLICEYDRNELEALALSHLLIFRDDVIFTPHNAYNSEEAVSKLLKITIDNIYHFLKNQPINLVKI